MKIDNERLEKLANITQNLVERGASVLSGRPAQKNTDTGVIYGKDVSMGTPVFDGERNTMADIQSEAAGMNARQTKDMMALLSNVMTEEDYAEYIKGGGSVDDTEVGTIVTVVEKIQISLAAYSDDYQGYVGNVSRETLEKMAGNSQLAYSIAGALKEQDLPVTEENVSSVLEAVSMAESLEPVADSTALYLIQNRKEPTIENMYIAQHSTGNQALGEYGQEFFTKDAGNYYSKIGAGRDYAGMDKKMEEIIISAGLEVNEDTVEAARWMVEHQIPLTEENLRLADRISEITIPQERKKLVDSIVTAMAGGEKAIKAPLTTDDNYVRRSEEVLEILGKATQGDIKTVIAKKEEVTLLNLQQEIEIEDDTAEPVPNLRDGDVRVVRAYRELEELRLKMTLEVSVKMMRKGIQVETTKLSDLVEQLRTLEEESYKNMLRGQKIEETEENVNLLSAIAIRGEALPYLPAAVLGNVLTENVIPTIDELYNRGTQLRAEYVKAEEAYETLGTAPRSDLGDSIQKAFQNTDSLLQEIGLPVTEENQRAVRILGYNSMELTEENIQAVKQLDAKMQYLMRNLTPSITLEMVREQINPLHMPVEEVNEEIARMRQDRDLTREEGYSKFLWKMEQNNAISPEEREAYVGIYRLLNQVEKSDGAAIGGLFAQGSQFTLQNLLTNIRSRRNSGRDVRVDDDFGNIEMRKAPEKSISAQIERGFSDNSNKNNSDRNNAYENETNLGRNNVNNAYETNPGRNNVNNAYEANPGRNNVNNAYETNPGRNNTYETNHERNNAYETGPDGNSAYGANPAGNNSYGNNSDGNNRESEMYQKYLAGQILDKVEPEKLAEIAGEKNIWDMDLEELLDAVRRAPVNEELEGRYRKEELQRINAYRQIEERVIAQLEAYDIPVTFRNLTAMEGILQGQGQLFKQLLQLDSDGKEELEDTFEEIAEASGDEESIQGVYEKMEQKAKTLTQRFIAGESVTSIDVRSMRTLYSQYRILGQMSRQEKYFVPMETKGGLTGVNLTIVHQRENQGKVQVTMETGTFGRVKAEFFVSRERISGYIAADSADGLERLRSGDTSLLSDLSKIQENVQLEYLREEKLEDFKPEKEQGRKVLTKELYGVARSFLQNLRGLA